MSVYLIPCPIAEKAAHTIPAYVTEAVKKCTVIFAENERSTRRYLKLMDRNIVIDHYEWFTIHKAEGEQLEEFRRKVTEGKNIAIISEAGCPGVADPGQFLIAAAQKMGCEIKPLVGPNSIILALMAAGMSGQKFEFVGYLPIENADKIKRLKELEAGSQKNNSTKIFIETPYRNDQLIETILRVCDPKTLLCIAVDITGSKEYIKTMTVAQWKNNKSEIHKVPAIFLLYAGII